MQKVAVIGAGTMGNGIAHVFAQNNFAVCLVDISAPALEKALATIAKNFERQVSKGLLSAEQKESSLANIQTHTDMAEALKDTVLVVEAATEDLNLKLSIFEKMDQFAPQEAILASNTSSISLTQIAAVTGRPDKVIGMHFMNPVPVMKLVEVIRAYSTSQETCDKVMDWSRQLGKEPTECNDYPGFVANRILMPMINEAIIALHEGVAGVTEIDTIMKLGMAHPMGPLKLADFIGLDVCLSIMKVLYQGFGNPKYAPSPLLVNMVAAGKLGVKSGEGFYDYQSGPKSETPSAQFRA